MSSVKAKRDSKEENIFSLSKLYCVVPIMLNMLYSLISHLSSIHIYIANCSFHIFIKIPNPYIQNYNYSIYHSSKSHTPVFSLDKCYHPNFYIKCVPNNYFSFVHISKQSLNPVDFAY